MNNKIEKKRADDDLPMWVVRDETPQELIDQSWNKGRKDKYFKPPINAEESSTYYERYAAWQKMWREAEQSSEAELDIPSAIVELQDQIACLQQRRTVRDTKSDPADNWPPNTGGM